LRLLGEAFPDLQVTVVEVLQDGDKVVVRSEITGTQLGVFMGVAGTGRALEIMAIDIHQVRAGRILHTWHTEDWMRGFAQLGVVAPG
jgi:predicted ester cyclase